MPARSTIEQRIRERIEKKKKELDTLEKELDEMLTSRNKLDAIIAEATVRREAISWRIAEDEDLLEAAEPKRKRTRKAAATDETTE